MLSRKVIFPMWLCMGAMDKAELSRVQMVSDSDWVGKSASVAHFICLSPTDSEFAPLRCVAIFSLRYNIEWQLTLNDMTSGVRCTCNR
jgi:hypothetical protein